MPVANAKEMLLEATRKKYSVGAFNVTSLVQMEAVVEAAIQMRSAVIIQTSVTPAKFFKPEVLAAAYRALAQASPYPVCLHLDHARGYKTTASVQANLAIRAETRSRKTVWTPHGIKKAKEPPSDS